MEIEINIEKKHFIFFVVLTLFFVCLIFVYAQTAPNPGHTASQISGVCRSDEYGCLGCKTQNTGFLYYSSATTFCSGEPVFCAMSAGIYTDNFQFNPTNSYQYRDALSSSYVDCQWVLCGDG